MKTVKDILDTKPPGELIAIAPDATVFEALEVLASRNFGALPVVQNGAIVGILSERDYAKKVILAGKASKTCKVSEIMTANPTCIGPEDTLETCMKLMIERGFRHLPVVAQGRLVHMISMRDAVRMLNQDREALLDTVVALGSREQQERERALQRISAGARTALESVQAQIEKLGSQGGEAVKRMNELLDSLDEQKSAQKGLQNARVLLATDNRAEELFARMALGGTGVSLETVSSLDAGKALLDSGAFDIICVNSALIDLAHLALEKNSKIKTVFMTSEAAESYVSRLRKSKFLSNVVSQSETDRVFTIRSVFTTVKKLVSQDYFGMEKYLNWGAEIREHRVERSADREQLRGEMESYLRGLGIRRTLIDRCLNMAEELLMNAIYDAPVDAGGKRLYNHLSRNVPVELKPSEHAQFRYGSDGSFLAISVRDPFGSIDRETVLEYLESCFDGAETPLHKNKGGGGLGLFTIFRSAHLTVFNVKKGKATEVIALFDLDPKPVSGLQKSSFHFFDA